MTDAIDRINPRRAPTYYIVFMAAWMYGFADAHWQLPSPVVVLLLVAAAAVHFGAGYVIARCEALALTGVPVLLALAADGLASMLWITIVLLMIFPGAPLVAAGVYARDWLEQRNADPAADAWQY